MDHILTHHVYLVLVDIPSSQEVLLPIYTNDHGFLAVTANSRLML